MSEFFSEYKYLESSGGGLFTVILKLSVQGKFPTAIFRNPYVQLFEKTEEDEIVKLYLKEMTPWLENGYAVVMQHCRGQGKSEGDFIPFTYEREDGLNLQKWVRQQPFYNGEIFLVGISYTSLVHCDTAPYADDIKAMISSVHDCNRYNFVYRNGVFKNGLFGEWYSKNYKAKTIKKRNYNPDTSFKVLPFKNFSEAVVGEDSELFTTILTASDPDHEFWSTLQGGKYTRTAVRDINVPVLLTTGFNDIFVGGIFEMWRNIRNKDAKEKSALVVSPYDHVDDFSKDNSICFENGKRGEQFGWSYEIDWLNYVRGLRPSPFENGKVTYYRMFENKWATDNFEYGKKNVNITLGDKEVTYKYDPENAPSFLGGLSCNFGGGMFQNKPYQRDDVITVYTDKFSEDTFVKGKMKAKLKVKSDCEDTAFYIRISIANGEKDFGIRDDIKTLCFELGDYVPDTEVFLDFTFDEHAFLVKKGEKLRIDIASANDLYFLNHTNFKGAYYEQTKTKTANNTVYLSESVLTLPTE